MESDHPSEAKPEHGADEEGKQKASNCAERIVPGIAAGCRHSVASAPCRGRFHTSMTSPRKLVWFLSVTGQGNQVLQWRALIDFNATIALVNDLALSLIAFGRCAESAHVTFRFELDSPKRRRARQRRATPI